MMDKFRFIRAGDKPVNEIASDWEILACFEPCTDQVRAELTLFIISGQPSITFSFPGGDVTIERVEWARVDKAAGSG